MVLNGILIRESGKMLGSLISGCEITEVDSGSGTGCGYSMQLRLADFSEV